MRIRHAHTARAYGMRTSHAQGDTHRPAIARQVPE